MGADRLLDIFSLMERHDRGGVSRVALCAVAAEFMALDGASIVLSTDSGALSLCSSNDAARALVSLEIVVGEGPSMDACEGGVVNEPDLLQANSDRWTVYAPQAIALGARAVFGYSIRLGAVRFGALSLFRADPGPLEASQQTDGFLMASVIGRAILADEALGTHGGLVGELNGARVLDFTVHQAAGMVAIQGSMSVKDALVALRAHAFATESELPVLAGRVVTRETRFDPELEMWCDDADYVENEG